MADKSNDQLDQKIQDEINKRIQGLVGERDAARQRADDTNQRNQELLQRLSGLEEQISRLSTPRREAPATQPRSGSQGSQQGVSQDVDIQALVRDAVNEAVGPVVQKIEQSEQQSHLRTAHQQSFAQVSEAMPELNDRNSQLHQVFERLWHGREELQQLPDAPVLVAHIAKGVVQDTRADEKQQASQKRNAAASPGARAPGIADQLSPDNDRREAAAEAKQKVMDKATQGNAQLGDMATMFRAYMTEQVAGDGDQED